MRAADGQGASGGVALARHHVTPCSDLRILQLIWGGQRRRARAAPTRGQPTSAFFRILAPTGGCNILLLWQKSVCAEIDLVAARQQTTTSAAHSVQPPLRSEYFTAAQPLLIFIPLGGYCVRGQNACGGPVIGRDVCCCGSRCSVFCNEFSRASSGTASPCDRRRLDRLS